MRRAELRAIVALTALAAALRFATLDVQSFWFDEAVTVDLLDRSFGDMLAELPDSESTPPLYYALAWVWAKVFGLGEVGLRSFSALLGTAMVPLAWLAARALVSHRAALAVAALAAVNPLLVWYSQEARSYALLLLLGTLSLWLCVRLLQRFSRRDAALWVVVAALALATHYFAAFTIAAEAALLLTRAPSRRALAPAIAAIGLIGLALLPLALTQEAAGYAAFIGDESLLSRTAKLFKQLLLAFDSPGEAVSSSLAIVAAAAGLAIALLRPDPGDRRGIRTAGAIGAATLALPFLLAFTGEDYVLTRNLILAWLPLTVVVAAGLTAAAAGRLGLAGLALLGALMLASTVGVSLNRDWQRENWRGAAQSFGPPTARAIVVTDPESARAIRLYRPRARRAKTGSVSEVILIARRGRELGDAIPEPPEPAVVHGLGFRPAGGKREPTFELIRLVTPGGGPGSFPASQLERLRLAPERGRASILFEKPDD